MPLSYNSAGDEFNNAPDTRRNEDPVNPGNVNKEINGVIPHQKLPKSKPNKEQYFGGYALAYENLDSILGPDDSIETPTSAEAFYSAEFEDNAASQYLHSLLFQKSGGAYNPQGFERFGGFEEDSLGAWKTKYAGYLPKRWVQGDPNLVLEDVAGIANYLKRNKRYDARLHPVLLDALAEYPSAVQTAEDLRTDVSFIAGCNLDLRMEDLVHLYKKFHSYEEFYTHLLKKQLRTGGKQKVIVYATHEDELRVQRGEEPLKDPIEHFTITRSKEDQLVNRFIFEVTPSEHRRKLFKRN